LAYAITVHKSQGSEYPIVIIPLYRYTSKLLTRNLFYTAITRAQQMVILVGNGEVADMMTDNNRQTKRYTGLGYFMTQYD
ncbi:MAG: ATP-binding domain-containing protein, partial [Clostridia bacterium]|nr:ATP-binding domain-containing protein [Clostridia bacterium]